MTGGFVYIIKDKATGEMVKICHSIEEAQAEMHEDKYEIVEDYIEFD